jgi:hypothetical protein
MKKTITLLAIIFCLNAKAQVWVTIPDTNFVNDCLHIIVPTAVNIPGTVKNLFGIQYFTSLTSLTCANGRLASIPAFPNSLQSLVLYYDSLTILPPLPNSITYVNCEGNQLTSLPNLPSSMTYLNCSHNYLTTLPTLPNSLNILQCFNNSLTSLPVLPNSITTLDCGQNSLTYLPTLPTSIKSLFCYQNFLPSLPALPNSIIDLNCSFNSLTNLPTLPDTLNHLFCQNNNIACFPTFPNTFPTAFFTHTSCSDSHAGFWTYYFIIDPNPYNCLPNHITGMNSADTAAPLCGTGNSNGCAVATGIEQINFNNLQVTVFPNPTSDQFYIETNSSDKLSVDLYDVNGRQVFSASVSEKSIINVSNFKEGVYTLTIKSVNGVTNKKLIIFR